MESHIAVTPLYFSRNMAVISFPMAKPCAIAGLGEHWRKMGMMANPPAIVCGADGPEWAFITGGESLTIDNYNYFVAWCDTPGLGGMPNQRVIICKLIVPVHVAKGINEQARRIWSRGGH